MNTKHPREGSQVEILYGGEDTSFAADQPYSYHGKTLNIGNLNGILPVLGTSKAFGSREKHASSGGLLVPAGQAALAGTCAMSCMKT